MLDHELEHLEYFDKEIQNRQSRPTIFYPIWHVVGYGLGAAPAIMGKNTAMACTLAVEDVIEDHYQEQIDLLSKSRNKEDIKLKEKIEKFQADEVHHKNIAIEHEASLAPFYKATDQIIRTGSKIAIWLSKRF